MLYYNDNYRGMEVKMKHAYCDIISYLSVIIIYLTSFVKYKMEQIIPEGACLD
jgi:hypothetical protein